MITEIYIAPDSILNAFSKEEFQEFLMLVQNQIEETLEVLMSSQSNIKKAAILHKLRGGLNYMFSNDLTNQLKTIEYKIKLDEHSKIEYNKLLDLLKLIYTSVIRLKTDIT